MSLRIGYIRLRESVTVPEYQTPSASGMDLRAFIDTPLNLAPMERAALPTGLALAIPNGWEGQIRSRSGLAIKNGLVVLNSPGTVDSDFRGEIMVILINMGTDSVVISPGDRIAQLVFCPVQQAELVALEELDNSARGKGGLGHTGVK